MLSIETFTKFLSSLSSSKRLYIWFTCILRRKDHDRAIIWFFVLLFLLSFLYATTNPILQVVWKITKRKRANEIIQKKKLIYLSLMWISSTCYDLFTKANVIGTSRLSSLVLHLFFYCFQPSYPENDTLWTKELYFLVTIFTQKMLENIYIIILP